MYFPFRSSFEFSSVCKAVSGLLPDAVLAVLSVILLPIKSPVASNLF